MSLDLYCLCRVILLYQNNQLRPDFFAPGSPWLQRSKDFRAAAEPLDAQIRLQEPASSASIHTTMPSLSPHAHADRMKSDCSCATLLLWRAVCNLVALASCTTRLTMSCKPCGNALAHSS